MKISCQVDCLNRQMPIKKSGKSTHCQLSIGRKIQPIGDKQKAKIMLMICSKQNRNGVKYPIEGNVQNIFSRFASEGKATIRLIQPTVDLCLCKADAVQLKAFLQIVNLAVKGEMPSETRMSSLAPASLKQVALPKQRLDITSPAQYPSLAGFPSSLVELTVTRCRLKRVDSRIASLPRLTTLDLSINRLVSLPDLWPAKLTTLHLNDNLIKELPESFFDLENLVYLNLKSNQLSNIADKVLIKFKHLTHLLLDHNLLTKLPASIDKLPCLQHLTFSDNHVSLLPHTFPLLRLQHVDGQRNPLMTQSNFEADRLEAVPSLQELCARFIKTSNSPLFSSRQNKILYTDYNLNSAMQDYLQFDCKECLCGGYCFDSYDCIVTWVDESSVSQTALRSSKFPCITYFCTSRCKLLYLKNPESRFFKKSHRYKAT